MKAVLPLLWCLLALAVIGPACGKRTGAPASGGGAAPPATPAGAAGSPGTGELPEVCEDYRRKLMTCMESSRFPKASRDGQRLALEQMLTVVREEQRRRNEPGNALGAAIDNCRDSLSTLEQSAKITCPGAF